MKTIFKLVNFALLSGNGATGGGSSFRVYAKKRKQSKSHSRQGPGPTPPRITTNVKHNLQKLSSGKEHRIVNTPKATNRYRKKKVEKENLPNEDTEDTEDTEYIDDMEGIFYRSGEVTCNGSHVLLVDGYNICHSWPKLKPLMDIGRLDFARETLIQELNAFPGAKVVVVFDAMDSERPTTKETAHGSDVDVVFTANTSADAWIENEVITLLKNGCSSVCVATNDFWLQDGVSEAGAIIWSSEKLVSEIEDPVGDTGDRIRSSSPLQGTLLKFNLDPKAVDSLLGLRDKLYETESHSKKRGLVQGKFMEHNLDREVAPSLKDMRNKLSEAELIDKKTDVDIFDAADTSTDAWIENEALMEDGCPRVSVAKNGCEEEADFDEVSALQTELEDTPGETPTSTQGRWLINTDTGAGNALKNLRDKLYETDPRTKRLVQSIVKPTPDPEVAISLEELTNTLPETETLDKEEVSTSMQGKSLNQDHDSVIVNGNRDPNERPATKRLSKLKRSWRRPRGSVNKIILDSSLEDALTELKNKPPEASPQKSRYY